MDRLPSAAREGADTCKALTICQPYAHLIATDMKLIENRNWYTSYRGPVAVHAGRSQSYMDVDLATDDDGKECLIDFVSGLPISIMSFGAIVAIAEIFDCMPVESVLSRAIDPACPWHGDARYLEHASGPQCLMLRDVQRIVPIPWRGERGLFDVPLAVLRRAAAFA